MKRATWSLLAIGVALAGWTYLPGRKPDQNRVSASQMSPANDAAGDFQVTPIQSDVGHEATGDVVTASGEEFSRAREDGTDGTGASGIAGRISDERCRALIVGEWQDEYQGKRHLTVRDDGTATMVVEPDGIGKRLFAAKLTFEIQWTLADGRVTLTMLDGEPKSKVQLILKLYGQEAEYKILEFNEKQMLLLDPDGTTRYDWQRPAATAEPGKLQ
jgi:hypothetical protein